MPSFFLADRPAAVMFARVTRAVLVWVARSLVWLLEVLPQTPRRVAGAFFGLVVAAGAVLASAAFCGPLDFACKADAWSEGIVEGLRATFSSLTESMILGIFNGSLGTLGAGGWGAGITLAGRVGAIMAIVVVALAAVQIVSTLVAKQRHGVLRAVVGAALAWPVASTAVWAAMQLVGVIDAISAGMVEDSHIETLSRLTDFTMAVGMASPLTAGLVSVFFVFCVFIPTVLLSLMMAFRNYGIVLAIAVAPVSLMVWGFSSLREMSRGWLKVVLALILTKPILAIALVLAAEMIAQSAGELEIGGFLTGVAGLTMAIFAPFAAMGIVSGAMAVADTNIMRGAEAGMTRAGGRAMNSVTRGSTAQGAKEKARAAGTQAAKSAAMTNPKTAAIWTFAEGLSAKLGGKSGGGGSPTGPGNETSTPPAPASQAAGPTPPPGGGQQQPGAGSPVPGASSIGSPATGPVAEAAKAAGSQVVGSLREGMESQGPSAPQAGGKEGAAPGSEQGGSGTSPAGTGSPHGPGASGGQGVAPVPGGNAASSGRAPGRGPGSGGGPVPPAPAEGGGRPSGGPKLA